MSERRRGGILCQRALTIAVAIATTLGAMSHGSAAAEVVAPVGGFENPQFLYENLPSDRDMSSYGSPSSMIVGAHAPDQDPAGLAARIHAGGSKAFAYVQGLWLPAGQTYLGIDIQDHLDWAFCAAGSQPTVGRVVNDPSTGLSRQWYLTDTNERSARDAFIAWFQRLRAAGFDGVFFDRGAAALLPGLRLPDGRDAYNTRSTCTNDPVLPSANLADSYVNLIGAAKSQGLAVMLNYGAPTGLRPDALALVDSVLDESTDNSMAPDYITQLLQTHAAGAATGKLVSYVKASSTNDGARRDTVFFKWARAKLVPHPVAVMSGEGGCATASSTAAPCLRLGIYPELTGATLNPAFGTGNLIRTACDPGSTTRCVFLRRYARGMVVVNNSLATKTTGDLSLNLKACRFLFNVYRQRPAGGACVNALNFRIPPMSGRVFRYATTVQGLASLATAP